MVNDTLTLRAPVTRQIELDVGLDLVQYFWAADWRGRDRILLRSEFQNRPAGILNTDWKR
jgi:hypothetical protein